jgi:hypothetical protein
MNPHMPQLTQTAVIPGVFAGGTGAVEMNLANTADIVVWYIPPPGSYRVPFGDLDLHCGG